MKYAVRSGHTVGIDIHDVVKYIDLDPEELKRIRYTDVVAFEVVTGEAAALIEAKSDGSCIDDYHEYLVLTFANGDTATFRNSYVDMFAYKTTAVDRKEN